MVEWHPYAARTDAVKVTCISLQCHPPPQQHRTLAYADFCSRGYVCNNIVPRFRVELAPKERYFIARSGFHSDTVTY